MANATLKTIAQICGVSIITVSKAINGKKDISDATREKILKVANEIGYVPNEGARTLRSGKNKRIGIIYDDLFNPFYQNLISKYYEIFKKEGYTLEFAYVRDDRNFITPDNVLKLPSNIDGVITFIRATQSMVDYYNRLSIPIIQLDINELSNQIDSFSFDDYLAGKIIAEHFYNCGCRNFGFIGSNSGHNSCVRRMHGVRDYLLSKNIKLNEQNVIFMEDQGISCIKSTQKLVNSGVDAIVYFNDMSAFEGKRIMVEMNVDNVLIAGFDNIGTLIHFPYKIPSVYGNYDELVERTSKILLQKINKKTQQIVNEYISVCFDF